MGCIKHYGWLNMTLFLHIACYPYLFSLVPQSFEDFDRMNKVSYLGSKY